jgi:hypothetical protein
VLVTRSYFSIAKRYSDINARAVAAVLHTQDSIKAVR